ncbi:MAG: ABC transporter permease [Bacteroidota bacterium]
MRAPKLAKRLFIWYCGPAQVDDLLGDMDEIFERNLTRMPAWRAKACYWRQVLSLTASYAIRKRRERASFHPHSNDSINLHMIKNYFMIAWRMMTRNKVYTTINVLGLTLGISACIIVYLVVSYEFSFDNFHPDKERIYRLRTFEPAKNLVEGCISGPAFSTINDNLTGSEAFTGYYLFDAKATVSDHGQEKHFDRNTTKVILTNPDYFKIFQYRWLAGKPGVLAKPMQVVLTESRARAYFGTIELQDIIGKNIIYNDSLTTSVAGVIKDWSGNSDFTHTEFISYSTIERTFLLKQLHADLWDWMTHASQGFIKISPGDNLQAIETQLSRIVEKGGHKEYKFTLEPLADIHFFMGDEGGAGMMPKLYSLSALAAFILIIAAINFINLSTAQSIRRSREIGIRKVVGSLKRQIIAQFLSETLVLAFISLCLSVALIRPLLWLFADFIPQGVTFNPLATDTWIFFGALILAISLLAGTYPALVMSSYRPAIVLSGKKMSAGRGQFSLRKSLIVLQFSASLFFIIATLVIGSQMDFIRKTDRGFSTESVITFRTNWEGEVNKVQTLVDRLRNVPGLDDVAMQGFPPMGFAQWKFDVEFNGKKGPVKLLAAIKSGDDHYIPLYKLRLLAGRNIIPRDSVREIVVNETLAKSLGFEDPHDAIGERFPLFGGAFPIVGVIQDFHQESFRNAIGPCIIGDFKDMQHEVAIRLQNSDILANTAVIDRIQSEFKNVYPDETLNYHFIEDEIGWMHGEEQKMSKLATISMAVTIFISCMGVFGLAMFTAAMRTREIGIRKVLGATSMSIVNMLSREFMILILVSIILATPIAWYYMNDWLLAFNYRTDLSWWLFALAAAIALVTGLITVSFQSLKAATGDPVKALRTE